MEVIKEILEILEVLGNKNVRVVTSSPIEVEGEVIGTKSRLVVLAPGDDISSYNAKVRAVCKEAWGSIEPERVELLEDIETMLESKPKKTTKKAK